MSRGSKYLATTVSLSILLAGAGAAWNDLESQTEQGGKARIAVTEVTSKAGDCSSAMASAIGDMLATSLVNTSNFVVLADAETVRAHAADRYLADTIARQLRAADLVILNKLDLVAPQAQAALHAWLETMAPGAKLLDARRAQLPLEAVLGVELGARGGAPVGSLRSGALQPPPTVVADALFEHVEIAVEQSVDGRGLATALADPALGVVRAKGILRDRDGTSIVLHVVGARSGIEPRAVADVVPGRLVCIGLKGRLDRAALRATLDRATRTATNLKEC